LSHFITVTLRDGSTVRAKVAGNGPPLILFANMVSWEFWSQQIPVLAERYRVIAPEYRREYLPGSTALDALADDVPDLVRALGYERALLMGHSIGAMVLARAIEKTPQVAAAVVLADGFLHLRVLPGPLHRFQPRLVSLLKALYPRTPWLLRQLGSFAALWADQHIFLHREPHSAKRKMFFSYPFTPDASMVLRVGAALEYHEPPDFSRATMPVLVVTGGCDRWLTVEQAQRLVEELPCGEHVIYPSVGHMVPMIVPESFNRVVLEFFGRVQSDVL
jgi:pimeloyl-ACP methyl ester carboxylesterase